MKPSNATNLKVSMFKILEIATTIVVFIFIVLVVSVLEGIGSK
jgi:hypothetical protein